MKSVLFFEILQSIPKNSQISRLFKYGDGEAKKLFIQWSIYYCVFQYSDREARDLWSQLLPKIPKFFQDIEIVPSLLHGDLWGGNVAETKEGPGKIQQIYILKSATMNTLIKPINASEFL